MQTLNFNELASIRYTRAEYRLNRMDTATRKQVWREKYRPRIRAARKALEDAAKAMKEEPSPEVSAAYIRARLALNELYKLSAKLWS